VLPLASRSITVFAFRKTLPPEFEITEPVNVLVDLRQSASNALTMQPFLRRRIN